MKTKKFREIDLTKKIMNFFRWSDNGRKILTELLVRSDKDPKDFVQVYDELLEYLEEEKHMEIMAEELKSRNVQCINFYDVVLDYILIDSFEVSIVGQFVEVKIVNKQLKITIKSFLFSGFRITSI